MLGLNVGIVLGKLMGLLDDDEGFSVGSTVGRSDGVKVGFNDDKATLGEHDGEEIG